MQTVNKTEFIDELYHLLNSLSKAERLQHLDYYEEMIADQMEDGLTEEEAVAALGSPADIAAQILGEIPPKPARRFPIWAIVLIVLGSPLWLSLFLAVAAVLVAVIAVVAAVYISLWAAIAAFYAADLAVLLGFLSGIAGGVFYLTQGISMPAVLFLGGGLVCAGVTVLLFFLCNLLSRLLWRLSKWSVLKIIGLFRRKGGKK